MEASLELKGVCKNFGGVVAAHDVDISVYPGQIRGLIGPNGAGKTTILNLISGIYAVDSGNITLLGKDVTKMPAYKRARMGLGRTFQSPRFLNRSNISDNLLVGTDLGDQKGYLRSMLGKQNTAFKRELEELMDIVDFSIDLDDEISGLPYGQLKQLEIVRTMLAHPKVMLVDEPAAGLNDAEGIKVIELLRHAASKQIGIILIEHSMDMVMSVCEVISVLNFGQVICDGTPAEVSKDENVIEAYLGRKANAVD